MNTSYVGYANDVHKRFEPHERIRRPVYAIRTKLFGPHEQHAQINSAIKHTCFTNEHVTCTRKWEYDPLMSSAPLQCTVHKMHTKCITARLLWFFEKPNPGHI